MADDVFQLTRMKPQVERVQNATTTGDAEIRFEVTAIVPGERRHAVAWLHTQGSQGRRETARTSSNLSPRRPLDDAIVPAADDRPGREYLFKSSGEDV